MKLDIETIKLMIDSKKELRQNKITMKKVKRILEVASVICSTASINMVIACLYGGVPDILGFKSQEIIFDWVFLLLVASVVLGTLAMATSRIQDGKLEVSFPVNRISELFSNLLTSLFRVKNLTVAGCEEFSKPVNTQPILNRMKCMQILKENISNQEYSNSLDNLPMKNSKDAECFLKKMRKSTVFSQSSDKASEIKSQLQKYPTPLLFGHCSLIQSTFHDTKRLKFRQFDLEQMEKKAQLVPLLQQNIIANGHLNEVDKRNIFDKYPQVGIVSPMTMKKSNNAEYYDLYKSLSSSVKTIQTFQKHPEEKFTTNRLEEQTSYQNTYRMSDACFKDDIPFKSNVPLKTFHKFPRCQRVFNNMLQRTDIQNLHEKQNKFSKLKCHDGREMPYTEILQTIPESYDDFSNNRLSSRRSNLHMIQEADSEEHGYKLHQKNSPNVLYPSNDFKETPHSKLGIRNPYCGWNINFEERAENFVERFDVPMEICEKAPNDQVLEVSRKLNELNFML